MRNCFVFLFLPRPVASVSRSIVRPENDSSSPPLFVKATSGQLNEEKKTISTSRLTKIKTEKNIAADCAEFARKWSVMAQQQQQKHLVFSSFWKPVTSVKFRMFILSCSVQDFTNINILFIKLLLTNCWCKLGISNYQNYSKKNTL